LITPDSVWPSRRRRMPLRPWTEYSKERAQDRGAESAGSEQVLNQDPNQHMNREMCAVAKEVAKLYPFPPTPRGLAGPGGLSPPPAPPLCTQTLCTQTPTAMCDPRFDRVLDRLPSPVRTMVRRLRQPSAIWIRWVAGNIADLRRSSQLSADPRPMDAAAWTYAARRRRRASTIPALTHPGLDRTTPPALADQLKRDGFRLN
jgi:hypothetical protein